MRNFLFSFLLLSVMVSFVGCAKNVEHGKQNLSSEARTWLAYQGGESLIFKNQSNEMQTFKVAPQKTEYTHIEDCNQKGIKEICDFYQVEQVFFHAQGDNISFSLSAQRAAKKGEFFDVLFAMLTKTTSVQASVEKVIFQENPATQTGVSAPKYAATLQLNDKTFQDVSYTQNSNTAIYVTHNQGVVGFEYDGDLWVLQND